MKKKKPISKSNVNLTRRKKLDDIYYKAFIGLCIANVVYYYFFEHATIGHDSRYAIYVFWIPMVLGLAITSRYHIFKEIWDDFFIEFRREKFFVFAYTSVMILLCNILYAYIIFGFSASAIWDYVNKKESEKSPIETLYLSIDQFSRTTGKGGANKIRFKFNENSESIKIKYEDIKYYLDKSPDDYQLVLDVRKGIWNYYTIEDWNIINKKK